MNRLIWSAGFLLFGIHTIVVAETSRQVDQETGLIGWQWTGGGMQLELKQRLPDQTRGFFIGRGFSPELADDIAIRCVFQTIVRNVSENDRPITVALNTWHSRSAGDIRPIKLKEQWDREWTSAQVSQRSRLAFRWATFPTQQTFVTRSDYNWGMISFDWPPGTVFNLHVVWHEGERQRDIWVKGIECPQDR